LHAHHRSIARILILGGALLLGAAEARAQGVTGAAVTGTITSEDGAPVEGAVVQLRNRATGATFTAVTDGAGNYVLDNVAAGGPYSLGASSAGYQPSTQKGIQLQLGGRLVRDLVMRYQVEQYEVVAQLDALDDHSRTGPSTTVKNATINRLPLQGRNFTDLVSTVPQASGNSIAGQNNRYNNIQIDGGANNDLFGLSPNGTPGGQANAKPLSIEAIQEFVVQVAPFDVRQGNFAGGLVNAITKSGTNDFHGSLFNYFQDKSLAGRRDDPTFLDYQTWQFGGTLGGPIVRDKLHFFVATDLQVRQSAFGNQYQIGGVDPVADAARAGFDNSAAQRFQDILAGKYGITNAGNALAPNLDNPDRNVFVKLTASPAENHHLELSYNLVNASQDVLIRAPTSPTVPGRLRDGYELSNSGYEQANTTHTIRAKLTSNFAGGRLSNELLTGVSIIHDERTLPLDAPLILVKVGQLGAADSWLAAGAERFSQANTLDQNIYEFQDNLTYSRGKHRVTLGTSNEFLDIRNVFLQASIGVWSFDSLDDFDAGNASAFQRRFGASSLQAPGTADFTVAQLGFYLQDEWSLPHHLTITPGIRFDVPFLSSANVNPVLVANANFPLDTSKVPSGNILWSPRLGFNWDPEGNANTIVRGGVGVFSGRPPYVWISNAYSINGLSQVQLTCTRTTGVPAFTPNPRAQPLDCAGGTMPPGPPTDQGEIDYFDPNAKYPQNLRAAVGLDRRLPWGINASFDFLYTQDINSWYVTDENLMVVGQSAEGRTLYGTFGATGFSARPTRIDTTNLDQAVKVTNKDGGRVYNATIQLQKQIANRLEFILGYTYSDSQDLMSLTSSQALSNFQFAPLDGPIQDRNLRPSAFDRPHRITLTGQASLPYGFGMGLTYVGQSGLPYTWAINGDVNGDGINGNDVVFVPRSPNDITLMDPTQYDALNAFINSQDCLREARGRLIERGACRNPWQNFLNLRLTWTSPDVRGQRFEAQFDIFNVLNLINSSWGLLDQATEFETHGAEFLKAVGYDTANNRPIYSFTAPQAVETTVYSPTQSRWRIQLGARYFF
jgi:outer membrane receptor protein involved in Fe transport